VVFPSTKIILAALRPRGEGERSSRFEIEMGALEGGIDGAEVPSKAMLEEVAKRGLKIKTVHAYGVLPVEYENRVRVEY